MSYSPGQNVPGVSKYRMEQLPPEMARVVDRMHVGEISDPFTMMVNGKTVCVIVKLKSRVNAHKANLTDDYETLYELITNMRREEALEKWIHEKQQTTFVRINAGWNDCDFMYPGWIKK